MTTDEAALRRQQQLKRVVIPLLVAVLFAVLFWPAKESPSPTATDNSTSVPVSKTRAGASEATADLQWPRLHLDRITAENPFLPPETQTNTEMEMADSASPEEQATESASSPEPAQAALPWWQMARDLRRLAQRLRDAAPAHAPSSSTSQSAAAAAGDPQTAPAGQRQRAGTLDGSSEQVVVPFGGPSRSAGDEALDHATVGRLHAIIHSEHGRIALLEGNRLIREGDRLTEGYQVVQITPDKILLRPLEPLLQPLKP